MSEIKNLYRLRRHVELLPQVDLLFLGAVDDTDGALQIASTIDQHELRVSPYRQLRLRHGHPFLEIPGHSGLMEL